MASSLSRSYASSPQGRCYLRLVSTAASAAATATTPPAAVAAVRVGSAPSLVHLQLAANSPSSPGSNNNSPLAAALSTARARKFSFGSAAAPCSSPVACRALHTSSAVPSALAPVASSSNGCASSSSSLLALPYSATRAASDGSACLAANHHPHGHSSGHHSSLHTSAVASHAPLASLGGIIASQPKPILRAKPSAASAHFHSISARADETRYAGHDGLHMDDMDEFNKDDDGDDMDDGLFMHSSHWRACLLDAELPPERYSPSARKQLLSQGHRRRASAGARAEAESRRGFDGAQIESDGPVRMLGFKGGGGGGGEGPPLTRSQSEKQFAIQWADDLNIQPVERKVRSAIDGTAAATTAASAATIATQQRLPSAPLPPDVDLESDLGRAPSCTSSLGDGGEGGGGAVAPLSSPLADTSSLWIESDASKLSVARGRLWQEANGEAVEQPCALEL